MLHRIRNNTALTPLLALPGGGCAPRSWLDITLVASGSHGGPLSSLEKADSQGVSGEGEKEATLLRRTPQRLSFQKLASGRTYSKLAVCLGSWQISRYPTATDDERFIFGEAGFLGPGDARFRWQQELHTKNEEFPYKC